MVKDAFGESPLFRHGGRKGSPDRLHGSPVDEGILLRTGWYSVFFKKFRSFGGQLRQQILEAADGMLVKCVAARECFFLAELVWGGFSRH